MTQNTQTNTCAVPGGGCASPRDARVPGPPTLLMLSLVAAVSLHMLAPLALLVRG